MTLELRVSHASLCSLVVLLRHCVGVRHASSAGEAAGLRFFTFDSNTVRTKKLEFLS